MIPVKIRDEAIRISKLSRHKENKTMSDDAFWFLHSQDYQSELTIQAIKNLPDTVRGSCSKVTIYGKEATIHSILSGLFAIEHMEDIALAEKLSHELGPHADAEELSELLVENEEDHEYQENLEDYHLEEIISGDYASVLDASVLDITFNAFWSAQEFYHQNGFQASEHIHRIEFLTSTGGPASRVVIDIENNNGWVEVQDWGTYWVKVGDISEDATNLLKSWAIVE